ncbi:MAG: UDP-N-acetylmuramoyl-L-alanine--D-glutamate ligase [Candidatus Omnitrophica bacterium]|nr:UDP-N-acetylmuramoyl-L-alanine--D-glutamate ligase [Candidatus Omnitrophota bacterium]MDD5500242.1 UDP-N-acetylmuramoyl-L-alanine--D-glutamate ligase [Candidatus Omnitrophota bacterium]
MQNTGYFKGKNVTIVGLARSGLACANLLHSLGARVRVTDINNGPQVKSSVIRFSSPDIAYELGRHSEEFISGADMVVVSPGVPWTSQPVLWAKEKGKQIMGEIEVAGMLCQAEIIAVTGSNGKTTVTTLIGKMLEKAGRNCFVCGNIGNPFSAEVGRMKKGDFAVIEVSSFQLETIIKFRPKIAVMLNLTPNHLDRYKDMSEYTEAKKRIFMNQERGDFLVLNADDQVLKSFAGGARPRVVFFDGRGRLNPDQSAVEAVGRIIGVKPEIINRVFGEFKGIEHRMEEVAEIRGVRFINDSKATTADSAIWAIRNISSPILLIAGGRHKGIDYRVIIEAARGKVKQAFLIGEAKDIIAAGLEGEIPVRKVSSLKEAVEGSYENAGPGDCVLFSPMCSSFDMFRDYEQRGEAFKKIVFDLSRNEQGK